MQMLKKNVNFARPKTEISFGDLQCPCMFLRLYAKTFMQMRTFILTIPFFLLALCARGQESQTVYNFLRLPVSAHAAALGGDNVTLVEDDGTLIFSNPALLASVSDKTINLNYMNYMSGANTASASYNRIFKEKISVAASAQYINYGTMKQMDENNIQSGDFSAKDISLAGYFSYMLSERIVGGITAKLITSYIGDYNSIAMGVDLGLNYYDPEKDLSLGIVARNLGGQLKAYDEEYESMPIDVQAGVTKRLTNTPFRLSVTMVDLTHWDYKFINHFVAGIDVMLSPTIWVGGGYNFRRANEMKISDDEDESSHGAGLSFGAGLNLERFKLNLAYGKYHVSSSSIVINVAYSL